MSDIEYLSIKEFDGKLVKNDGIKGSAASGDLVSLTANSGKDLYLAKAKVNASLLANGIADRVFTVTLNVNGSVVDTWKGFFRFDIADGGATSMDSYEFPLQGVKVAAAEIIKLEVTQAATDVQINGALVGFEENTGETPKVT